MFIELHQSMYTLKGEDTKPTMYRTASIIAFCDNYILLSDGSEPRVAETKDQILQIMKDQETAARNEMLQSLKTQTGQVWS